MLISDEGKWIFDSLTGMHVPICVARIVVVGVIVGGMGNCFLGSEVGTCAECAVEDDGCGGVEGSSVEGCCL